jgi:hypothetical protein
LLLPWVGCGESRNDTPGPAPAAGQSPAGTGGEGAVAGTMAEGAAAGDPQTGDAGDGSGGRGGSAGSSAGSSGSGGASGTGATGGLGTFGGTSGAGGTVAGGGSGGLPLTAPDTWTCLRALYRDGTSCECGCGAPDPDCEDQTRQSCDVCKALGSCSSAECPGSIAGDDNSKCALPPKWGCSTFHYGDGYCDCGCGAPDVDCPDASPASCDLCPQTSCTPLQCEGTLVEDDNTSCLAPPVSWQCSTELWNDGARCDCGCGYLDPDCNANAIEACDQCNAAGSCSNFACPGVINVINIAYCAKPAAPDGWTCEEYAFGDNQTCDCGCGVLDVDCNGAVAAWACDSCAGCGDRYCNGTVDPEDNTQCLPPPEGWTCHVEDFGNFFCDCGCGVPDPDCNGYTEAGYCYYCPAPGCAMGECERIDPMDNTMCVR